MKQKLALSRALIHEPRILFLDEPTAGLDPESAHMVRDFIRSLKKERTTVFLCTHNLTEASSLSDRICFIKKKIIRIASLGELQNHDRHRKVEIVFGDEAKKFIPVLKNIKNILEVDTNKNTAIILVDEPEKSNPGIIRELTANNIDILYINEIKASLEEIYLELIKDEEAK